jgi:hypothetical protein
VRLAAHGIGVDVPSGWDVRVGRTALDWPGSRSNALVHAGNFALPEQRGDFGSGAVEQMGSSHVLVVLMEYGPESATTALFQHHPMPRKLRPHWFSSNQLQRTLAGQSGMQRFFVEKGRPFCLYVVLGSHTGGDHLVSVANAFLGGLNVSDAAARQ